jgi:hypothetical protein
MNDELKEGDKIKIWGVVRNDYHPMHALDRISMLDGFVGIVVQVRSTNEAECSRVQVEWECPMRGKQSGIVHRRQVEKVAEPREWTLARQPDCPTIAHEGPCIKLEERVRVREVIE